ncbi:MAG: gluconokinase [Pseudomonadota bacterium]
MRVVVMGVAGCGKSSVGEAVAEALDATYLDGDDLHPAENIAKMSAGTPLTDDDRAPWLDEVGQKFAASAAPLLIGCSALKRHYRDRIRAAAGSDVCFLHLNGTRAVIEARMSKRAGHFMPVSLLNSQFADLELLQADESGVEIDIAAPFDTVVSKSIAALRKDIS